MDGKSPDQRVAEALAAAGLRPDPTDRNTLVNPADPGVNTWTDPYTGETFLSPKLVDGLRAAVEKGRTATDTA